MINTRNMFPLTQCKGLMGFFFIKSCAIVKPGLFHGSVGTLAEKKEIQHIRFLSQYGSWY